ncbi:hypothetical protein, partial [Kingella oralis]|uniref:hypothetical protein n=1 Tax=Kingella oralis TaxID=505 RepID=UPI003C6EE94C
SAARRHFASQQSYGDLLFGDEPSPFHRQPEMWFGVIVKWAFSGCLNVGDWVSDRQPENEIGLWLGGQASCPPYKAA